MEESQKENQIPVSINTTPKTCIHSRNILSYLDLSDSELQQRGFSGHLGQCKVCQDKLDSAQELMRTLDARIPTEGISRECQLNFERDLREIFKLKQHTLRSLASSTYIPTGEVIKRWAGDISEVLFNKKTAGVFVGLTLLSLVLRALA